jgi:excisionase family DNA binding protein
MDQQHPLLMTISEVAQALRVSKVSVYRMVHSGALSSVRINHAIRVPAEVVASYLTANTYSGDVSTDD